MDPCPASYDAVADLYDRHWGQEFSAAARSVFDTNLFPLLAEGSSVLDLCCGTGLILAHLDRQGFAATGLDESARMLSIAHSNAPNAQLHRADMAEFDLEIRFAAVVSFYNSMNHARSLDHLRATLTNVARHLAPDGYFLFDYVLPEAFETAWEWCEQIDAGPDVWTFRYTFDKSTGRAACVINEKAAIHQTSFDPTHIHDALRDAKLSVISETPMGDGHPQQGRRLILATKSQL